MLHTSWKFKHFDRPLVAGFSIGHKPHPLHIIEWDLSQTTVHFKYIYFFNDGFCHISQKKCKREKEIRNCTFNSNQNHPNTSNHYYDFQACKYCTGGLEGSNSLYILAVSRAYADVTSDFCEVIWSWKWESECVWNDKDLTTWESHLLIS